MEYQSIDLLLKLGKEYRHSEIKNYDVNDTECMICSYVFSHEGCCQDEVSEALMIDKTTITKALQSLENKGFVNRYINKEDKRRKSLALTEKGKNTLLSIINLHDRWFDGLLKCLNEEERKVFDICISKLVNEAKDMCYRKKSRQ